MQSVAAALRTSNFYRKIRMVCTYIDNRQAPSSPLSSLPPPPASRPPTIRFHPTSNLTKPCTLSHSSSLRSHFTGFSRPAGARCCSTRSSCARLGSGLRARLFKDCCRYVPLQGRTWVPNDQRELACSPAANRSSRKDSDARASAFSVLTSV